MASSTLLAASLTAESFFRHPLEMNQHAALVFQRMVDAVEQLEQSEQLYRYPELVLMTAEHLAGVAKHGPGSAGSVLLRAMHRYNLVPRTSYLIPYGGPHITLSTRALHEYVDQLPCEPEIAPGVSTQMYREKVCVCVWRGKRQLSTDLTL